MSKLTPRGFGWHRDLPDHRDLTPKHDSVVKLLHDLSPSEDRPDKIDSREFCGPIHDQQDLATSSVHACLGMIQYFERRCRGTMIEPSRMFVYRTASRVMGWADDGGLPLRTTLETIGKYGFPMEEIWPYEPHLVSVEPDPFVYASADRPTGGMYIRLDDRGQAPEDTLETLKRFLAGGFAIAFGFAVSTSVTDDAEIPFPTVFDGVRGGQAVLAVGYDDKRRIRSDRGALLVANSWGAAWGDQGFGWIPYNYVLSQLAADFWTILTPDWVASGELQQPAAGVEAKE